MATYAELRGLFNHSGLLNSVTIATVKAAQDVISTGSPTAKDRAWALKVFKETKSQSQIVLMYVLAANSALTLTQITGASDAAIQAKVDDVRSSLIDALAGV